MILDLYPAGGRHGEHDPLGGAVEHHRHIELLVEGHHGFDVEPVDTLTGRAGLVGDQTVAQ